jgi:hypothetical protein
MRPRATPKDENHKIVTDFMRYCCGGFTVAPKEVRGRTIAYTANYRGVPFLLFDTADFGGVFPDYQLFNVNTGVGIKLEVKEPGAFRKDGTLPDHELKPGEKWLRDTGINWRIIVTDEDVRNAFDDLLKG